MITMKPYVSNLKLPKWISISGNGNVMKEKAFEFSKSFNWKNSGPLMVGWKNQECLRTWNNWTLEGDVFIPTILLRYKLNDIFNVDENGLFYHTLPTLPREKLCT